MRGSRVLRWFIFLGLLAFGGVSVAQPADRSTRRLKIRSDSPDAEFYLIRSRVLDNLAPAPDQRPGKVRNGGFLRHSMNDEPIVLVDADYYVFVLCGNVLKPPLGRRFSGRTDPPMISCR